MQDDVLVSVICNTYNHEKFVRQALEGFVMQKTDFKFEVLIHDDASTDKTADIIREFEAKYPEIIKPIYQTENQYSQKISVGRTYQFPRAKGKYIAMCEGDDAWIDENKLQKQVNFLETHENCIMTCHNSLKIDYSTGKKKVENPIEKEGYATAYDMIVSKPSLWIAWASLVFRRSVIDMPYPEFFKLPPVGDMPRRLFCFALGDVYYFEDVMSIYNYKTPGSWSGSRAKNIYAERYIKFFEAYNEYTDYKYNDYIQTEILKQRFHDSLINYKYDEIIKKEYRQLYENLSLKEKIYIWLRKHMPFVAIFYSELKSKLRKFKR